MNVGTMVDSLWRMSVQHVVQCGGGLAGSQCRGSVRTVERVEEQQL